MLWGWGSVMGRWWVGGLQVQQWVVVVVVTQWLVVPQWLVRKKSLGQLRQGQWLGVVKRPGAWGLGQRGERQPQ